MIFKFFPVGYLILFFNSLYEVSIRFGGWWDNFYIKCYGDMPEWEGREDFQGGIYHGWCHAYLKNCIIQGTLCQNCLNLIKKGYHFNMHVSYNVYNFSKLIKGKVLKV